MPDLKKSVDVIVPTVGDPQLVLPCVQRLLECTSLTGWQLVLVVNPIPKHLPTINLLHQQVRASVDSFNAATDRVVQLQWLQLPGPAGWTGAVNAGVQWLLETGLPDSVCVMNDDVLVTPGWLKRMQSALQAEKVMLQGEVADHGDRAVPRSFDSSNRIGMVGPMSNEVAGVQQLQLPEVNMSNGAAFVAQGTALMDRFASDLEHQMPSAPMTASFLSGLCVLYSSDCLQALLQKHNGKLCLLNPVYGTGGYDDNDVAVRAALAGFRMVVARNTYVHHLGHQTLDQHFPEAQRGLANAATYLRTWEEYTKKDQRLVAVYRVGWEVPWDVEMLGASLRKVAQLVDGIALVTSGSPAQVQFDPQWKAHLQRWAAPEQQLLQRALGAQDDLEKLSAALELYLLAVTEGTAHPVRVAAHALPVGGNERDERNAGIRLALQLEPDWCLSVDHDEIPEDRITRKHLQRLMRHPDPGVTHFDCGWLNHWDSPRLTRVDSPWAHGYKTSMRGFRLWRVQHQALQNIQAGTEQGLHCGNVPDAGHSAKRVAALRFRHYGYLRLLDRMRKFKRYQLLDQNPDPVLTVAGTKSTGGYEHLVNEEGMQMQPYMPGNGIGLTMMWHAGEHLHDLMRWLDLSYGVVDHIVLVWTGPEDSAPSPDMQYIANRFGARWVHHPMQDDLGAARNAGVNALRELGCCWCWVMDPDEHLSPAFNTLCSIRRMAESTDCWAWMFRFRNHRPDGNFNWSENTRMFKLHAGILKFGNRVHETIEGGLAELGRRGVHPNVRFAPFNVEHYGLARGDEATQAKLQRYTHLLVKQIQDAPGTSPGAWISLGLQYGNDGDLESQWRCYEVALATAGNGYLPFREAALWHLRHGRKLLEGALARLSPAHQLYDTTSKFIKVLRAQAPDQPLLGAARAGRAVHTDVDLDRLIGMAAHALDDSERPVQDVAKEE